MGQGTSQVGTKVTGAERGPEEIRRENPPVATAAGFAGGFMLRTAHVALAG